MDGPFTETKEAVGGYLVLQADNIDEAVEIARSMPTLRYGISVEVRPILAECPIFQRHPELASSAGTEPSGRPTLGRGRRVKDVIAKA